MFAHARSVSGPSLAYPGPFCTRCKEPLGDPKKPISSVYKKGKLVGHDWYTGVVGTDQQNFCVCLHCLEREVEAKEKALLEVLSPDQRHLFQEFKDARNDRGSYFMMMS